MVEVVDVSSGQGNLALPVWLLNAKKVLFPPLSASVRPLISNSESYGPASYAKELAGLCTA